LIITCTPQKILLKGDCIGCHSTTGATTLGGDGTPYIFNTSGYPASALAGGNFHDVITTDSHGHNVAGLVTAYDVILNTNGSTYPPGFTQAVKPSNFTATVSGWGPTTWGHSVHLVTCAGEYGCHGNRSTGYDDYAGIRGGHHSDKHTFANLTGGTTGSSYRFLAGIRGDEESDYEGNSPSSVKHNGYYGVSTYNDSNTISYLCGECHGDFHANASLGGTANVGSASPWLRHPTDVALAASGGSSFTTDYTVYNTETPVGYASPSSVSPTVNSSSIVICLSCHAAHGTTQPDILRFNYSTQIAGGAGTNGCLRCHQGER
jgi:hypothetical protein